MLIASDNPALYDLYDSPSRSPFSNLLGQGIRGMPAAPGSLQGPMQSLSQLQGQLSGLGIGGMNQASPFASSIRPDIRAMQQAQVELARGRSPVNQQLSRMAAPGTDMATGLVEVYENSGGIRPQIPFPTPKPDIFPTPSPPPPPMTGGPTPPPISQPPRPFGGNQFGGIGGFFNQLAQMSPEQYSMGMDRFGQFRQQFGPSMGGGFGMFNQLAQMTPEQYSMGMDRFSQFNQKFGQMPPPMTGGPRPNPYGGLPISRPFDPRVMPPPQYLSRPFGGGFGGGFGGQRFQPQMMPYGRGFGGGFNPMPMTGFTPMPQQPMINRQTRLASGEIIPAGDGFSIAALQGGGMSAPAVQPTDPNQGALFRTDAGAPMTNTAQSGGGALF